MLRHTGAPFAADNGLVGSMGAIVSGLPITPVTEHLNPNRSSTAAASAAVKSTSLPEPNRFLSRALLSDAIQTAGASAW